MLGLKTLTKSLFGTANDRQIKTLQPQVDAINALEESWQALTDDELRGKTAELKERAQNGESLDQLLPEAFATVREGAKRSLGQRHYDVQLMGGIILHQGKIAEMKTGEGKTLVATLAVYLNALSGKGVHVVTVNDYLAARDAEWMGQVYEFLGLTVGCVVHGLDDEQRRRAYAADVTYGTNNEFGFDYLRDNMKYSLDTMVQREHNFAIVDEVDSILVDEARTPLIISGPTADQSEMYRTVDKFIPLLTEEDYEIDEKQKSITLTEEGNEHVEEILKEHDMLEGDNLYDVLNVSVVHHVNQALRAHKLFERDKDYIVKNGQVIIIDEFTGRMMEGRRYSDGQHQALEAKEDADIQPENQTLASVTFQNYFRLYDKLSGMTGTAMTEADEFEEIYGLHVVAIPTNVPIARLDEDDEVYRTANEKFEAVIYTIADCHFRKQPILVGTTSIEKSETLAKTLSDKKYISNLGKKYIAEAKELKELDEKDGKNKFEKEIAKMSELGEYLVSLAAKAKKDAVIPHSVLNARYHEQEAQIIALAGIPGAVTIATNMAGRGTDIQLGGNYEMRLREETGEMTEGPEHEETAARIKAEIETLKKEALDAGGLYVLGTERHESRRIDNQLRGRTGRQGDPGVSKFYLSLQDDLMRIFGSDRLDSMLQKLGLEEGEAIVHPWINRALEKAQQKVEARNFDIRKNLLKYDDVMNDQRKAIFEQRIEIMRTEDVNDIILDMRHDVIETLVATYVPEKAYAEQWDIAGLKEEFKEIFDIDLPIDQWAEEEGIADQEISERLIKEADRKMAEKAANFGPELMRRIEKHILLQTIDMNWREHLSQLDHLRQTIGLRGYAQRNPLNEYKTEAFSMFEHLLNKLRSEVSKQLALARIAEEAEHAPLAPQPIEMEEIHADPQTGENEMAEGEPGVTPSTPFQRPNTPADPNDPSTWGKVARNAPCPCNSGKKYKHCHGSATYAATG